MLGVQVPLLSMMDEFATMRNERLGQVSATKLRTEQTEQGKTPSHQYPYCASPLHRELQKMETNTFLAEVVIETANTGWASPAMFARKKGWSLCLYVDYQNLNADTVRNRFSILEMDECTASFGNGKIFLAVDANAG